MAVPNGRLRQRLICFEMSALITKPRALAAVLSYCFHELETHWLTGEPVVVALTSEVAARCAAVSGRVGSMVRGPRQDEPERVAGDAGTL